MVKLFTSTRRKVVGSVPQHFQNLAVPKSALYKRGEAALAVTHAEPIQGNGVLILAHSEGTGAFKSFQRLIFDLPCAAAASTAPSFRRYLMLLYMSSVHYCTL